MKAMILKQLWNLNQDRSPLELVNFPYPSCKEDEVVVEVATCGVCRTELDEIEGRTSPSFFPMILGHEIVGRVVEKGSHVQKLKIGDRVGIAWIHSSCGKCSFCLEGRENLCAEFEATGRDAHGGYAEYTVVKEDFAFPIPSVFSDEEAAPLLCAGAVGYRSLKLGNIQNGMNIGFSGFGASAHLVLKAAQHLFPFSKLYVFTRNEKERAFARELGATWAGDFEEEPPEKLHLIIDTTPAWKPVVLSLRHLEKGGRLVINAIRKEKPDQDFLLKLNYSEDLWMEKEIKSVANVTRANVQEFLQLAAEASIRPEVQLFSLEEANRALMELKDGKIRGAKVLRIKENK
ncbi:MAG: zinc-dependent alcohol dehydrogenase family protein [Candidatus Atribacteria bacterium]|nr:zinc-dependent alcohol dehydrogenase family protein [Candidatus Atribacteria bacterium]